MASRNEDIEEVEMSDIEMETPAGSGLRRQRAW